LTLGVMVGAGSVCLGYTGQSLFLPNWFIRRRGLATGIAFAGVGIGSVILLPWVQRIIEQAGWRTACWTLGLLILVVLVPINLLLRKRPQDIGLEPDGDAAPGVSVRIVSNVVDPAWAEIDWTLARAVRTARFWWLALGFFCGLYVWYAVQVHQTKYLIEIGFSPSVAAWALGLVCLLGIPSQIVLGHLSDRIGREWAWSASGLGFAICFLALIALGHSPSLILVYVMVAAQGLLGFGLTPIMGAVVLERFQGRHYGSIFGTLLLTSLGGAAAGPWSPAFCTICTAAIAWHLSSELASAWSARPRSGSPLRAGCGRSQAGCTSCHQPLPVRSGAAPPDRGWKTATFRDPVMAYRRSTPLPAL
jgi:MFS family permease